MVLVVVLLLNNLLMELCFQKISTAASNWDLKNISQLNDDRNIFVDTSVWLRCWSNWCSTKLLNKVKNPSSAVAGVVQSGAMSSAAACVHHREPVIIIMMLVCLALFSNSRSWHCCHIIINISNMEIQWCNNVITNYKKSNSTEHTYILQIPSDRLL